MSPRKKLIEVALSLEAVNTALAWEESPRHGYLSTLHLWWTRRPLAACRAVLFSQLVDDPSSVPEELPDEVAQETERRRLLRIIGELVQSENSNNQPVVGDARREPFAGQPRGAGEVRRWHGLKRQGRGRPGRGCAPLRTLDTRRGREAYQPFLSEGAAAQWI